MQRLNMNKPLRAKAIYFKGSSKPMQDCIIWIAANFLVVAKNEDDTAPTWYNVDRIVRLEGVEELPKLGQPVFW